MKNILFILLSTLVFIACGNKTEQDGNRKKETQQSEESTNVENSKAHRFFESRGKTDNSLPAEEESDIEEETLLDSIQAEEPEPTEQPVATTQTPAQPAVAGTPTTDRGNSTSGESTGGSSNRDRTDSSASNNSSADAKTEAREFLRLAMREANTLMSGKEVDYMTTCEKIEFRNDIVYYYYIIDENQVSIETLRGLKDTMKQNITTTLYNTPDAATLIEKLEILGGKIIYVYTGNISEESTSISLQF